jgi:tetratricopeptide (TPR) repeat protein
LDAKKYEEALTFADKQQGKRLAAGLGSRQSDFALAYCEVLIGLGKLEQAISEIKAAPGFGGGNSFKRKKSLLLSFAYSLNGNFTEAKAELLKFDEVLKAHDYFSIWIEVNANLLKNDQIECEQSLIQKFHRLGALLEENGALRKSFVANKTIFDISIRFGLIYSAKIALERMQKLIPQLQKDLGASEQVEECQRMLEGAEKEKFSTEATVNSDIDLDDATFESLSLEQQFAWCKTASVGDQNNSQNFNHAVRQAECYAQYHDSQRGRELLQQLFIENQTLSDIHFTYGRYLINNVGEQAVLEEFNQLDMTELTPSAKLDVLFLLGVAHEKNNAEKAIEHFRQALEIDEQSTMVIARLAKVLFSTQKYLEAQELFSALGEMEKEETDHQWDILVSASINEDWATARQAALTIGMELDAESGEIDENWGNILIDVASEHEKEKLLFANRTGPVSAIITAMSGPDEPQHFKEKVIFQPTPLNELNQTDDEGDQHDENGRYYQIFRRLHTVSSVDYFTFAIDGFHPGDELLQNLIDELIALGAVVSIRSDERYTIFVENGEETIECLGVYIYVLVPADATNEPITEALIGISDILKTHSQVFERPIIWPALAERISDEDALVKQEAIEEEYGF